MYHGFQGDVIIVGIDKLPTGGKKVKRSARGYVLAEGEATGHAHTIDEEIELIEKDGILYIGAKSPVTIKHEEHAPITLPAGNYEATIAQEYSHFEEEARAVRD